MNNIPDTKTPFVPLTSDGIFKALFRYERYLKDFLEDVLKEKIQKIEYLDTYLEKDNEKRKENFLDVLVKFDEKNYVIVEMQKYNEGKMISRIFYYLGKLADRSLKSGEEYKKIKKYIGICVLDYNDQNFTKLHNTCRLYDIQTKEEVTDMLEIHILNLRSKKINDNLRWLQIFKEEKEWNMSKYSDEELKEAVKELKRLSGDPEVSAAYDKELKEKLNSWLIEEEYVGQGIAKGKAQKEKEAALNFYKNGVAKEVICKSLNITLEKLENILKESNE